jgi:hypothetical protein
MMAFIEFMASSTGRTVRIITGFVLIILGLLVVKGFWGDVIVALGLIPLMAGAFDVCLLAPLVGAPFSGRKIRHEVKV